MTPEAALTKLAYVLSRTEWSTDYKRQVTQMNLRGELTSGQLGSQDWDLMEAVARSLKISSPTEHEELGSTLFPAMLNAAVLKRDVQRLELLKEYVSNVYRLVSFRESRISHVKRQTSVREMSAENTRGSKEIRFFEQLLKTIPSTFLPSLQHRFILSIVIIENGLYNRIDVPLRVRTFRKRTPMVARPCT